MARKTQKRQTSFAALPDIVAESRLRGAFDL
jgi:hypothetical protein